MYGQLSLEHRFRFGHNGKMEHLITHLHIPRTTRSPFHSGVTEGSYHSSLFFMLFPEVWRKQQSIGFP
ncbi:hypothetical protein MUK42_24240 [Musa troglodytarum]|uniref:Uncharacterized protein n=2 Tax=Musa troglodytarum TaxID=320322 RepID=A0A9E7F1E9_9LILI|nr:hypothetical protein MUK42_24240 [Musa troglodytarum]